MEEFTKAVLVVCCVPIILLSVIVFLDLMAIPKALNRIADELEKSNVADSQAVSPVTNIVPGLHWIDNADSWLCPICLKEVSTPTMHQYRCPRCGFMDEKDVER